MSLQRVWHKAFLPSLDIPSRFAHAAPESLPEGQIRTCVNRYIENFWDGASGGMAPVFLGAAGTWKTYGAWCIARYAHWQRVPTQFVHCGPFFTELDSTFYTNLQSYHKAVKVGFLVLDDFTQVKGNTRAAELLANLVAERFAEGLPTMFTGNYMGIYGVDDLRVMTGDYRPDFVRRLWHGSGGLEGYFVTLSGGKNG